MLVSACLLGHRVTYRGEAARSARLPLHDAARHGKRDVSTHPVHWLRELSACGSAKGDLAAASPLLRLVPVCPEAAAGFGVPRPPVRLVGAASGGSVTLQRASDGADVTDDITAWQQRTVFDGRVRLGALGVPAAAADAVDPLLPCFHGFVGQGGSPSCGVGDAVLVAPAAADDGAGGVAQRPVTRQHDGMFTAHVRSAAGSGGGAAVVVSSARALRRGGVDAVVAFVDAVLRRAADGPS